MTRKRNWVIDLPDMQGRRSKMRATRKRIQSELDCTMLVKDPGKSGRQEAENGDKKASGVCMVDD
jgi:hypothetical protein